MSSGRRRFAVAFWRAQALTPVLAAIALTLVLGEVAAGSFITVPGFSGSVPLERLFPALLATAGALPVAVDWGDHERCGARSALFLRLGRFLGGGLVAFGGGALIGRGQEIGDSGTALRLCDLAVALFLASVALLVVWQRGWWLALPVLLYAQFFLAELPWEHLRGAPLAVSGVVVGLLYVLRGHVPQVVRISSLGRYCSRDHAPRMAGKGRDSYEC